MVASSPLSAIPACFNLSCSIARHKEGKKKNLCLNRGMIWIRQPTEWVTNSSPHSFIHITSIRLKRDIWGSDVGGGWNHRRCENGRFAKKGEPRSMCLPPLQTVTHRQKGALLLAFVGPRRRRAEMEEIIAEMRYFFLLRICWDLISGEREGRWERLRLSVCLPLIEVGRRTSGWSNPPPLKNPPPDKFTRHRFLRAWVERIWGVVTERQSRGTKQRELNLLVNQLQTRRDNLRMYLNALNVSPRCFSLIGLICSPHSESFTQIDKRLSFP